MQSRDLASFLMGIFLSALAGCAGSSAPPSAGQATAENFQFNAHLTNGLVLSGHLPDESAKDSLMNLAASIFPDAQIVNEMITDGISVSGWHRTTRWGLSSLSKLEEGRLVIIDHTLLLEGRAANAAIKSRVEAATIGLKAEIGYSVVINIAE